MGSAAQIPNSRPACLKLPLGTTEYFAPWIDRSHHLRFACKFQAPAFYGSCLSVLTALPDLLSHDWRGFAVGIATIFFPCNHKLPGDARHFICERDCYKFWRLSLQQRMDPFRANALARSHMAQDSRGTDHQCTSQSFVSGSSYYPCPCSPCGGVVSTAVRFQAIGAE